MSRWQAFISVSGKLKHLGNFEDESVAALAYDKAARSHHGARAKPNFPDGDGPRPSDKNGSSAGGQKVGHAVAENKTWCPLPLFPHRSDQLH
jgi:hypothetical protein